MRAGQFVKNNINGATADATKAKILQILIFRNKLAGCRASCGSHWKQAAWPKTAVSNTPRFIVYDDNFGSVYMSGSLSHKVLGMCAYVRPHGGI